MSSYNIPKIEESILEYWKKNKIIEKNLKKNKGKKEFVFYEGPPTANGLPGIHHVLTRVFKDIICKYKVMKGYYVFRKAGWDTHGLPVEIEIEKKLGIKTKSDIIKYGIKKFNKLCKKSVWNYKKEWEELSQRISYWLDFNSPYITYEPEYIETLFWIIKQFHKKDLLYKDFRVMPYCPRCETSLSSHELAQGYKEIKDESIYIKFKIKDKKFKNCYFVVWTTTPWTLPGNVALAINKKFIYVVLKKDKEFLILEKNRAREVFNSYKIIKEFKGKELLGILYEPVFDLKIPKNKNVFRVYHADFVKNTEGSGIVHIAPAFGEEDFLLAKKNSLPAINYVSNSGRFDYPVIIYNSSKKILKIKLPGFSKFVKSADKDIKKYLSEKSFLIKEEKFLHKYPFCWRCQTLLIYYLKESWFVKVTKLKDEFIKNNEKINWIPSGIKYGRFGNFLKELKDWNFSRERFWGTPLPVWECKNCNKYIVIGSRKELLLYQNPKIKFLLLRHGESESVVKNIASCDPKNDSGGLTKKGIKEIENIAKYLKGKKIDIIFSSDLKRTRETSEILAKYLNLKVVYDKRLREYNFGVYNLMKIDDIIKEFGPREARLDKRPKNGESLKDLRKRIFSFIKEIEKKYKNKTVLIVSHKDPLWIFNSIIDCLTLEEALLKFKKYEFNTGELREVYFKDLSLNDEGEVDLHRPYIDKIKLICPNCKSSTERVPYVVDVWFDSGSMPFAQVHFPFKVKNIKKIPYPADYICEGVDQTRGWFYTLLAVSTLLGLGPSYKNVISLGLVLDEHGRKMSKSRGNVIAPDEIILKYGSDPLRWFFYVVNNPGNSKRFKVSQIEQNIKDFILIYINTLNFLKFYFTPSEKLDIDYFSKNLNKVKEPINKYILLLLKELQVKIDSYLQKFEVRKPALLSQKFITDDFSRFYIRIIRDILKSQSNEELKKETLNTLSFVLLNFSKLTSPFLPFISEYVYLELKNNIFKSKKLKQSVHLEDFPKIKIKKHKDLLKEFEKIRKIIDLGLSLRKKVNIKVRQPLKTLYVNVRIKDSFKKYIEQELNILKVKEGAPKKKLPLIELNKIKIWLDTEIDKSLKNYGDAREFVRKIQQIRKEKSLTPNDKIILEIEEIPKFLEEYKDYIVSKAMIREIKKTSFKHLKNLNNIEIDKKIIKIRIIKT